VPNKWAVGPLIIIIITMMIIAIKLNLHLSFLDVTLSRIHRSISVVPEQILFKPWPPYLLFSHIQLSFSEPPKQKL
jgi:hypothetical protein